MIFKEKYLHHPVSVIMFFLFMLIIGIISFTKLPVSLMPEQKTPWISIIVEYPGISPQKMEGLITKPIEEKISTISGIKKILSISEEGKSRINLQFDINKNVDFLIMEIREKVDIVKVNFPREVQEPLIIKYDPSETPVFIVTLKSDKYSIRELRDLVEHKIKKLFQRVDGVSEIFVSGGLQREIHIDLNYNKLLAKNIGLTDVFREVQFANVHLSSGIIYKHKKQIPLLTPWKYITLNEIKQTGIFTTEEGKIIKVSDLGEVKDTFKEKDSISRVNLDERVSIYIQKAGTANTVKVIQKINEELNHIKSRYKDIDFDIVYNQAKFIKSALNQVKMAVIIGSFIAGLVLLVFLKSIKSTIIIGISIPVSLITTFTFFYFKGISLNVFSLSGLALAAGMLVDNSIIVLEHIHARKEEIAESILSIEKAVIASTLTTIAVFLPIVFTNKEIQIMYGDITLAIIFSICFSLFTALILLPVLKKIISKQTLTKMDRIDDLFISFYNKIKNQLKIWDTKYKITEYISEKRLKELLQKTLKHYKKVLIGTSIFILIVILLAPSIPQEYINPLDTGNIRVFIELPSGTNLTETDKNVKQVETLLKEKMKKSIKRISSRVEKAHATLVIELNKKRNISTREFIRKAKSFTKKFTEFDVIFSEPSEGSSMGQREVTLNLTGKDPEKLKSLAAQIARELKDIKKITDIIFHFKPSQEQISIRINQEQAILNNLSSESIAGFLREAIYGPVTTKFFDKDREIDIRIKLDKKHIKNIDDLRTIYIRTKQENMVPLDVVSDIKYTRAPSKIYRLNKHRTVSMAVKYDDIDLNRMVQILEKRLNNFYFPNDYTYEFGENYQKLMQNRREMILAILFAFVLIYLVLASILENIIDPLIIIMAIPIAVSIVLMVFLITNNSLNVAVYIGLIMLSGIVVNNSILLVDTTNQYCVNGYSIKTALIKAVFSRIRPIFMTTLTTVLGLMPILLNTGEGSNLWQPLAITIITGLLSSTFLILFIIPAFYYLIHKK